MNSILDFEPNYTNFAHFLEVTYKGKRFYLDGDTIIVRSYLPQNTEKVSSIRFARINASELSTPEGKVARDALKSLLTGKLLLIKTEKDSKTFDRYIAEVWIDLNGKAVNVNDWMVNNNFAVYQEY